MAVLIVNQAEVVRLLPMRECMTAMANAMIRLARNQALQPLRIAMFLPGGASGFGAMPAYLDTPPALGLKAVTVFPRNQGTPFDCHQGVVLLFEMEHGRLRAILDASAVTAIRTAAVSGVATRLLARKDACDLAILGSGVQARTHLEAMLGVRPIRRIRLWSRNPENARRFADRAARRHGITVDVTAGVREAVEGADLICTTTATREPILRGEWIAPGAHINAVGSSRRDTRELDSTAIARSRLFVDRRESTFNEAGDFLLARAEGAVTDSHVLAELGEILAGSYSNQRAEGDITVFKSLGLAIQDVAAAQLIYDQAVAENAGQWVELGGQREL